MTSKNIPRLPRTQRERRVFSQRKRQSKRLPVWRMLLESLLLLMLGIGLLAVLSWLPTKVDAIVVVSEAIADLIRGLSQLLEAFLGLSFALTEKATFSLSARQTGDVLRGHDTNDNFRRRIQRSNSMRTNSFGQSIKLRSPTVQSP